MPVGGAEVTISSEGNITGTSDIRAGQITLEAGGDIGSAGSPLVLFPLDGGLSAVAGGSMGLSVNPIISVEWGNIKVETLQAGGDIDVRIWPAYLNDEEKTPAESNIRFSGPVSAGGDITVQVLAHEDKSGLLELLGSVTAGGNVSITTFGSNIDVHIYGVVSAGGPSGAVELETGGEIYMPLDARIWAPGDATVTAGGSIRTSWTSLITADNLWLRSYHDTVGAGPNSGVTVNLTGVLRAFGENGVYVQNQGGPLTVAYLYSREGGASLTVRDTAGESDFIVLTTDAYIEAKKALKLVAGDGITLASGALLRSEESVTLEIDAGSPDPDAGPGTVLDFSTADFYSPVIRIRTGSGNDVIRVKDLPEAGTILDIKTGAGDDTLLLGDTDHILSFLSGTILFDGGAGADSVSVDNSLGGVAGTGTLWLDSASSMAYRDDLVTPLIRMTGMGDLWYLNVEHIEVSLGLPEVENLIDIDGTGAEVETVKIHGTSAKETFRVGAGLDRLLSGIHGLVSLDGGEAGEDSLSIVENNFQQGLSFIDDRLTATPFTGQGMNGGITWNNISTLSLSLLGNTDLTIAAAPEADTTVTIGNGTNAHTVRIGEGNFSNAEGRAAFPEGRSLLVSTTNSHYTLEVDDHLNTDAYEALLNADGLSINGFWPLSSGFSKNHLSLGSGGGTVWVLGAPAGLHLVTIAGGEGDDLVTVSALPAGTVLDVQGGAGNDELRVWGASALQATVGPVFFQGGEGTDTIRISAYDATESLPALFLDRPETTPWPHMGCPLPQFAGSA
jgi:hypothetical protein